jgi:hypothetical protein
MENGWVQLRHPVRKKPKQKGMEAACANELKMDLP